MERPPKKYVCEKCGYLGNTSEHEGCNYLAWTTGEQRYIDHLEAELASLRASPASAPEGAAFIPEKIGNVESGFEGMFLKEAQAYKRGWNECRGAMLAAAPTPPVSEDRKDAERFRFMLDDHAEKTTRQRVRELFERLPVMSLSAARADTDAAMYGEVK